MKYLISLSFFLFLVSSSHGQEVTTLELPSVNKKHSIGFAAGFTTGYGLSYRYIPAQWGLQVTYAPFKDGQEESHSFGLTLLYELMDAGRINFFLYQGNHFFYDQDPVYNYLIGGYDESVRISRNYNHGVGIGTEFRMGSRITMTVMTGYAAYNNFNSLSMTLETGLYFQL